MIDESDKLVRGPRSDAHVREDSRIFDTNSDEEKGTTFQRLMLLLGAGLLILTEIVAVLIFVRLLRANDEDAWFFAPVLALIPMPNLALFFLKKGPTTGAQPSLAARFETAVLTPAITTTYMALLFSLLVLLRHLKS